ncbi:DUF2341 domain-containing protein [Aureispira anguillae]|uniref:DUF2341 domain-containing protein n=1 Tax=Aureispira anguillae TaxID=2864201 RepID=A0A915YDU4_9BACT|nr:DUF2341 domain-containing protein [Aureispira anguillae]BDS11258.1 DUF2341 domain-containing protein [Aureispira anguillae]
MKPLIGIISLMHLTVIALAQPTNYGFGKQIEIQSSQVSGTSTLSNFPLLVSFTDPDLRLVANGGKVENANGYDITFTLDDCNTSLHHQIEKYDPATGEYIAWVNIPSLSASANTEIHMYYGNNAVTSNPSTKSIWGANVAAVYHLSNNDFDDATSNGMDATNHLTTNVAGKIGDARNFSGSGQYLNVAESGTTSLDLVELTMSAWIFPTNYNVVADRGMILNKESTYEMGLQDNTGAFQAAARPSCWRWAGTRIVPLSTWSKVTIVFAGGLQKHYVNGVFIESFVDCSNPLTLNDQDLRIGARGGNGAVGSYFIGNIDEVKITNREETADWIATEYNNQNAPSTFYTVSTEMMANDLCILLPTELRDFDCTKIADQTIQIEWETVSETNIDYFMIERSPNGLDWEVLGKVDGAGNSTELQHYKIFDYQALLPISYYRLKQVDLDGEFSYSEIRAVTTGKAQKSALSIYPNPVTDQVILKAKEVEELSQIRLFNALGQDVTILVSLLEQNKTKAILDLSNLGRGIYYIKTKTSSKRIQKR